MSHYLSSQCNFILQNLSSELRSRCPEEDQYCCYMQCCFINKHRKEVWETWYFWFGLALIGLLILTSGASFLVGKLTRKQHQLVRVQHCSGSATGTGGLGSDPDRVAITAVAGPDGIIQPRIMGAAPGAGLLHEKRQHVATAFFESGELLGSGDIAAPLDPAYPPVQPVTVVRGTIPERGFRETESYTELVLPPGYVNLDPSLKASQASCSHQV